MTRALRPQRGIEIGRCGEGQSLHRRRGGGGGLSGGGGSGGAAAMMGAGGVVVSSPRDSFIPVVAAYEQLAQASVIARNARMVTRERTKEETAVLLGAIKTLEETAAEVRQAIHASSMAR